MSSYKVIAKEGNKPGTEVEAFTNMYSATTLRDKLNDAARVAGTFNDRWYIVMVTR